MTRQIRKTLLFLMVISISFTVMMWPTDEVWSAGSSGIQITNADDYRVIKKGKTLRLKCTRAGEAANKTIKYKSSNTKVASVSTSGVVRAKKNGRVYITAYIKTGGKVRYKDSVKLRVGIQVKTIKISGSHYVREGTSASLQSAVAPKSATVKKLRWSSSNPKVAKVTSAGKVKGLSIGKTTITARAADGSGKKKTFSIEVYEFSKEDTLWVAHRGLHTSADENTAEAFRQAGQAQFWGCECDIRETKDGELVIQHDDSFARVYNVDRLIRDMTAEEIREHEILGGSVCFFDEFLDICYAYDMVPVVELKDENVPEETIAKAVETVLETGLRNGADEQSGWDLLERTDWISFDRVSLYRLQEYIKTQYGLDPLCTYLVSEKSQEAALQAIEIAVNDGFDGISCSKKHVFDAFAKECRAQGLMLDLWPLKDTSEDHNLMFTCMKKKGWEIAHIAIDFKPYR